MTDFTNWTHAVITFHAGASYSVGGFKFVRNVPKRCPSLAVRKKLEGVQGFVIRDFFKPEAQAKPAVAPAVKKSVSSVEDSEDENTSASAPVPVVTTVKKKTVKRKVKKTKGGE